MFRIVDELYLAQPDFIQSYLSKLVNASADDRRAAHNLFDNQKLSSIMTVEGSTAFISITGVLTKQGPSPLARFFGMGGTGYLQIIEALEAAVSDDAIEKIILKMDTPGGEVNGVDETFQAVTAAAKVKTVIAENNGLIASAGYYIAVAAKTIVANSPTAETGSIGVIIAGIDTTKLENDIGIKRITIRSANAPNKAPDIGTKKGRDLIQERANSLEKVFIERVAEGRGVTEEIVKSDFGKGAVLIAVDAEEAGMIDKVTTSIKSNELDKVIIKNNNEAGFKMDLQQAIKENPAIAEEVKKLQADAKAEGIKAEQEYFHVRAQKAAAFLKADGKYPAVVLDKAVGFLAGQNSYEVFEVSVAAFDASVEGAQSVAAQGEQPPETPPDGNGDNLSDDALIRSAEDMEAATTRLKEMSGAI